VSIFNVLASAPNPGSIPSYSVSASSSSINEGDSVTFSITTSGLVDGTVLYWTNGGTTTDSDFTDRLNSGSFTITNNSGSVTKTLLNDQLTEGTETIIFQVRIQSTSGAIVASSNVNIVDTSTIYGGQVLSYDFTSNNATASFYGVTITGNYGASPGLGTYTITNNNGYGSGVNGGLGLAGSGNTGGDGGAIGQNGVTGRTGADVSGLFAAVSGAGTSLSNFGAGGGSKSGSTSTPGNPGFFAGGGGGGNCPPQLNGSSTGGTGANGAIVYQYQAGGTYYGIVNQSAGAGSFTFPAGTTYVKIWCVGRGGNGGGGYSNINGSGSGSGGRAGGVGYCEFYS
jgi:hypothetical protein